MIPMSSNTTVMSTGVPAFVAKLWHMVSDESCDDLICWSEDGTSFIINDQARFCSELLPRYYKHNNAASFIRQLNKYGFHKVSSIESSSLRNDKVDLEFAHEFFVRGCVGSLEMIKRKMASTSREIVDIKGDMTPLLQQLLLQVQELKDNHETFESKIASMKRENDALWREHSILRQKYVKQNKMINQLIQFLATLVQQTRGVNVNRSRTQPIILRQDLPKGPLMAIEAKKKDSPVIFELNPLETDTEAEGKFVVDGEEPTSSTYLINSPGETAELPEPIVLTIRDTPGDTTSVDISPSPESLLWGDGPSIENTGTGSLNGDQLSPFTADSPSSSRSHLSVCPQDVNPPVISSGSKEADKSQSKNNYFKIAIKQEKPDPLFATGDQEVDPEDILFATETIDTTTNKTKQEPGSSLVLSEGATRQDFENHIDVVQSDLDSLKDILQGLDTSAFLTLFNEQDPLGLNLPESASTNNQQLVTLNPGFMDISDLLADEDETDPLAPSPTPSEDPIESILNTPQPTPSNSAQPTFNTPKRLKKK